MGVTLERVQFKFASIIGELCSEPDVLSQFAVWVDLRLAEYKLKGSISLDCSGDLPDPVWLKGILSALLEKKLQKERQTTTHALERKGLVIDQPLFHSTPIARRTGELQLRSHQNIDSTIFPMGAHTHRDSERIPDFRKRRAPETLTQFNSDDYNTQNPSKLRRKDGTHDDPITIPHHESLMSIIGVNAIDTSTVKCEAATQGNGTGKLAPEIIENKAQSDQSSIHIIHGDDSQENSETGAPSMLTQRNPSSPPPPPLYYTDPGTDGVHIEGVEETPQFYDEMLDYSGSESGKAPHLQQSSFTIYSHTQSQKITQHVRNSTSAGVIFGRWLRLKTPGDKRKVEEIEPAELDVLLAEFFMTVKKKDGGDYYPRSLNLLRTCLESHLRTVGYPVSLTKSSAFWRSTQAFKERKAQLEQVHRAAKMTQIMKTNNTLQLP